MNRLLILKIFYVAGPANQIEWDLWEYTFSLLHSSRVRPLLEQCCGIGNSCYISAINRMEMFKFKKYLCFKFYIEYSPTYYGYILEKKIQFLFLRSGDNAFFTRFIQNFWQPMIAQLKIRTFPYPLSLCRLLDEFCRSHCCSY